MLLKQYLMTNLLLSNIFITEECKKLLITWRWGDVDAIDVVRDWEGNLHWNAFYTFRGELSSTSELETDSFVGWMYMPEPFKEAQ